MYSRSFTPEARVSAPPVEQEPIRLPFLAWVVLASLLIPAYYHLGPLYMNPSKTVFLILVPVLTINLLRGVYGRILTSDALMFAYAIWMTLAMLVNHSPSVAIEYTGSNTITALGGYLAGRATIRTPGAFIALIRLLATVIIFSLPFVIYEVHTSRTTIPRWLAMLPNITSHADINHDPRMGLWRAQFNFSHPIHYGLFCSMAFSLVYLGLKDHISDTRRIVSSVIIALCCFFSVSSGPFLALAAQIGLILWAASMKWTPHRWRIFYVLALIGYTVIELGSTRPGIFAVVERLSFSSGTAHYRRSIFNFGIEQVKDAPLFGIGLNRWNFPDWMTGSVDNHWLLIAGQYGIPAFLIMLSMFIYTLIAMGRRDFSQNFRLSALRQGWIFTMISLMLTLATVAMWREIESLIMFMFAAGLWMRTVDTTHATQPRAEPVDTPARYTRFARPAAFIPQHRRRQV